MLNGGRISEPSVFGIDPLQSRDDMKAIRYTSFCSKFSFKSIFCETANGCGDSFRDALLFFIDVTYRLAHTV